MTLTWNGAALVAGTVATGLMAGLFAAFSYAIMPGLGRTDDATFVPAMQRINVAILNPVFGLFFGGAVVCTALALLALRGRPAAGWVLAGLLLYVAVLVVTFAVNVPLNNRLDAATGDPAAARAAFEAAWVRWNLLRTALCTAAFGCLCWALVLHGSASAGG